MDILIKGMEMPASCQKCGLLKHHVGVEYDEYYSCGATGEIFNDGYKRKSQVFINPYAERLASCPLVELPTPHGKLVDADVLVGLCKRMENDDWNMATTTDWSFAFETFRELLEDAPTIIEAEGVEL